MGVAVDSYFWQMHKGDVAAMAVHDVQEQGSFAVGGAVITTPGTFDPINQGAYNPAGTDPAGQTLHGESAARSCHCCFVVQ